MSRLILVRHGNTLLDSGLKYWGSTDVELSPGGIEQAEKLRDRLAKEKIDAVYSSDLKRAYATASIIASKQQLEVNTCTELREIDFGNLEGSTYSELRQLFPEVRQLVLGEKPELRFPGGESFLEFNQRIARFTDKLGKYSPEETLLIVSHGGTLRMIMYQLSGKATDHWLQIPLELASLSILELTAHGIIARLLNDVSHLKSTG